MLFKLLWWKQPLWQILGASLGAIVGITLLMLSLQSREVFSDVLTNEDDLFPARYLTLSKKVSLLSNLPGMKPSFTQREIKRLREQPGIVGATPFVTAGFKTAAIMAIPNFPEYYTELFLESLPTGFLESHPSGWQWTNESPHVPILLPNSFLNLYNFGFAPANGYPQVSKGMIQTVRFTLRIQGKSGRQHVLPAKVAAFSDRITTILVPESFMNWANAELVPGGKPIPPYRILVKTETPIPANLPAFLEKKNYETNRELLKGGRVTNLAKLALGSTASIGLLLLLVAFLAFWLSFQVLVQRSAGNLRTLLHIGYPPGQLARHYLMTFLALGVFIYAIATLVANLAVSKVADMVSDYGLEMLQGLSGVSMAWALLPTAILILGQCLSMRATLEKLAKS